MIGILQLRKYSNSTKNKTLYNSWITYFAHLPSNCQSDAWWQSRTRNWEDPVLWRCNSFKNNKHLRSKKVCQETKIKIQLASWCVWHSWQSTSVGICLLSPLQNNLCCKEVPHNTRLLFLVSGRLENSVQTMFVSVPTLHRLHSAIRKF
jgi:hypothetical protein